MTNIRTACATFIVVLLSPLAANAALISLVPTSPVDDLNDGDIVSFDVVMDFSDYANGTLGGGFDIFFDSSVLQLVSFFRDPSIGDPDFSRDPDVLDGLLESWAVGAFLGLDPVNLLGNVVFEVLSTAGGSTFVGTQATSGVGGPWIDGTTFVDVIPVEYGSVEVTLAATAVPAPGTLALLVVGLAAVGAARTKNERKSSSPSVN